MKNQILYFTFFCATLFGVEHVHLKTPHFSSENIIETKVGIRPVRKMGVRIEEELLQDKLIVHNYGYGGSGLTLCFGGAKEVVDIILAKNHPSKAVAILGSGVAGLTVAYDLLELGFNVHIYAKEWPPHLTSNIAAGIWSPLVLPEHASDENKQRHAKMLATSESRFLKSIGENPEFAGIKMITAYSFKEKSTKAAIKSKERGDEVVAHFDNGVTKFGKIVSEIGIEGQVFMKDLFSKVQAKGAVLQDRYFESVDDILTLEEPIVINCTSMGSRELFNDQTLIPVRGQIIHFKPQEKVDFLFFQNIAESSHLWVSIYPWSDRILLGGIYEEGKEKLVVQKEVIEQIIKNAEKCLSENLHEPNL